MTTASTEVVKRERLPRHLTADVSPPLDELVATANREHELFERALEPALTHGLAAGEALLMARRQALSGDWDRWLSNNFVASAASANRYMRLAAYKDELGGHFSMKTALEALRGLPDATRRGPSGRYSEEDRQSALRALDNGGKLVAVAASLGVSTTTVWRWRNPEKGLEQRRRCAARRRQEAKEQATELREQEIRRAVRKAGAALAEAYSMSARMAAVLAQAEREAETPEARESLDSAIGHYHRMRDDIVRALGVS